MKNYLLLFILAIGFAGCKKSIQAAQTNIIISAMTDGQWRVTNFMKGSTNNTAEFANYKFQFLANYTVQAINNSTIENTGSWNADANSRTITSNFSGATPTISLLNGTWAITNNSWTFVEATQTVSGQVYLLRLDK